MTAEKLGLDNEVHELKLGDSFSRGESVAFHSMRCEYKCKSIIIRIFIMIFLLGFMIGIAAGYEFKVTVMWSYHALRLLLWCNEQRGELLCAAMRTVIVSGPMLVMVRD